MKTSIILWIIIFYISISSSFGQSNTISGSLNDDSGDSVLFAHIALYTETDSSLIKVVTSNENGFFSFNNLSQGSYFIEISSVGYAKKFIRGIQVQGNTNTDLGQIEILTADMQLDELTITASRELVEIKPDRTVFNVDGTVNSTGSNALGLLRKAPGVTVDHNDNIHVLGRPGVLLYVDGKRIPLTGDDLVNYIQNIPAEQIDRIDIISNPGVKYEAEGSAGIIDIRLKRDKNIGTNGTINSSISQGQHSRYNIGGTANFRNKKLNAFGSIGNVVRNSFNDMAFESYQNEFVLNEVNNFTSEWQEYNYRLGLDYFISKNHTLGFLISGKDGNGFQDQPNSIAIAQQLTPSQTDSTLVVDGYNHNERAQNTFNINYQFDNQKGNKLNIDLDYGKYENNINRFQPNRYFNNENTLLTEAINHFETPSKINIYTFKVDYESPFLEGTIAYGSKLSSVETNNTYLFYDEVNGNNIRNNQRSNLFNYTENVYATYVSYSQSVTETFRISIGLRTEQTDAEGQLTTFSSELAEPPVILKYWNWFPNAGINWKINKNHNLTLNYGKRINRPDYNVLNPFNDQMSQLAFEKGNPYLRPEIVNNLELGYTLSNTYHFKLGYSKTDDQITRLLGPDENDPRANFVTWENLAKQTVFSLNISAPITVNNWWEAYFNLSASHIDNQADYGEGAVVDLQAFTYKIYQQHTFNLPHKIKAEISGFYSGPGVWGGVFELESRWSLNLGLQRKFLDDKINARISVSDIFYKSGWKGKSDFDGLLYYGNGQWDSRRVSFSLSYKFGNQNIKSRKRKTGLESEGNRVSK